MTAQRPDSTTRLRVVEVPSSTNPTTNYIVTEAPDGTLRCNCAAGWWNRPCRHVRELTPVPMSGLRPVRHPFGCGERIPCPKHGTLGVYLPAERLRNGDVIAHDCGSTWRPHELASVVPA